MADVFAYIKHADGVADDSALELIVAAKKIAPDASVTAVVTGSGADLDKICSEMATVYNAVWKIDNAALAYPNAEVVRKALVAVLPADSIVLLPHDTFGMDLGPGLSIKMDSTFAADIVGVDGVDGTTLKVVRQEFSGAVSTHVTCDISAGAVLNIRPGVFQADVFHGKGERPPLFLHGLVAVGAKIHQHLVDLGGIAQDHIVIHGYIRLHTDGRREA